MYINHVDILYSNSIVIPIVTRRCINVKHTVPILFSEPVESKEILQPTSEEEMLLKKLKKKKKKKHKDGEREKTRHSRPKMYHRSSQTVCAGVSLELPDFLTKINGNSSNSLRHNTAAPHQDHLLDSALAPTAAMAQERLGFSPPLQCAPSSSPVLEGLEFARLIHVEQQANGGASVAHTYTEHLAHLSPAEMQRFAQEFVTLSFSEDQDQAAHFVMGIIHGAASYLPDFLDYFSYNFPNSPVKMEVLGKKDIETTTMANFCSQVSVCCCCCLGWELCCLQEDLKAPMLRTSITVTISKGFRAPLYTPKG